MRYIRPFFFIIFIAVGFTTSAQTTPKEDTAYVNKLLQESKGFLTTDTTKALALARQAQEIARKIKFPKGEAYALKNMGLVYYFQSSYIETLDYWSQSLKLFEEIKDDVGISNMLNNMAAIYHDQGDDPKALELSLRSLQYAEKTGDKLRIMTATTTIGSIYHNKKDPQALDYVLRALSMSEQLKDTMSYVVIAGDVGEIYSDRGELARSKRDSALARHNEEAARNYLSEAETNEAEALTYYEKAIKMNANPVGLAFAYNGRGKLFTRKGKYDKALNEHYKALEISEKIDDKIHRIRTLRGIAGAYEKQGKYDQALGYYKQAQIIGEEIGASVELKDLYKEMAYTFSETDDYKNAFLYKSLYADVKDSLYAADVLRNYGKSDFVLNLRKKEAAIQLSEAEVKRQKIAKQAIMAGLVMVFIIAFVIYRNYRMKVKTHRILDKQKVQIENLLLNILPVEVAQELQTKGHATPRYYESVSVLFTDFKGFTSIADKMTPEDVVQELNKCFAAFDDIVDKYDLEKIKTIGDSYMCAGGIPTPTDNHICRMVKASLDMLSFIENYNDERTKQGLAAWNIRIGIHVGPVVAGVVGKRKYAYDIWGSTVNIASRMESNGFPGLVNISEATYQHIKNDFACDHRGKIYAKNVGDIDMYFVKHEISPVDGKPLATTKGILAATDDLREQTEKTI